MSTASPQHVLRLTTAGSVDDGKSTLIGRMLYEAHAVLDDQLEAIEKHRRIHGELDLSLLTDGLKSEREQGITIDVAYKYFASQHRKFILADSPGHVQYTRNMVTAASLADVALILIDARLGVLEQTRRHAYLCQLLKVPFVILLINKIDLIDYDPARIEAISHDFLALQLVDPKQLSIIPVSALKGDNISQVSQRTPYYQGLSLLDTLDRLDPQQDRQEQTAFPIQLILRDKLGERHAAGTLSQGRVEKRQKIKVLPSGRIGEVASLSVRGQEAEQAIAGEPLTLTLSPAIDLERGQVLIDAEQSWQAFQNWQSSLIWFDDKPLQNEARYILRLGTQTTRVKIKQILEKVNLLTLQAESVSTVQLNDIVKVSLETARPLYARPFAESKEFGAFILIDPESLRTVAAGLLEQPQEIQDSTQEQAIRLSEASELGASLRPSEIAIPSIMWELHSPAKMDRILSLLIDQGFGLVLEKTPSSELALRRLAGYGIQVYNEGLGI